MSGSPLDALYWGSIAAFLTAYLVAFVRSTGKARAAIRENNASAVLGIAERWAQEITNWATGLYVAMLIPLALVLSSTNDGWAQGGWLFPVALLALFPLRLLALKQNRIYARLFLGVTLPLHRAMDRETSD